MSDLLTGFMMKREMEKKDWRINELEVELRALRSVFKETINENLDLRAKLIKLETKVTMLERGITLEEGD